MTLRLPRIDPPWWFCCGWWSPWCVIDTIAHEAMKLIDRDREPGQELPGPLEWICDRHDRAITAPEDYT